MPDPVLLLLLAPVVPLHLGALHPVEKLLTVLLAVGPFVVLGVVVWWRRRSEAAADRADRSDQAGEAENRPALDG